MKYFQEEEGGRGVVTKTFFFTDLLVRLDPAHTQNFSFLGSEEVVNYTFPNLNVVRTPQELLTVSTIVCLRLDILM